MKQRIYIDVNAGLGRSSSKEERIPYTAEELQSDMEYFRVHASLVYSNVARDYSFVKGNNELLEQIRLNPRLYGAAVIIPEIGFEKEEGFGYFDRLAAAGIRAFKVYPRAFEHEFNAFSFQAAAEYMLDKGLPLVIDVEQTDWRDLRSVLEAFPGLKVVVNNTYWEQNRYMFPLMARYGNLYMDVNSDQSYELLDVCKKHFGIGRVLFGTNYPNKVMGGLKALVEYSRLTEAEKDMVAWRNAAGLFNIPEPELYPESSCRLDELALRMDMGLPLKDITVIDAHTHLCSKEHSGTNSSLIVNGDEDGMVKKMDTLGIDKIFVSSWEGIATDGVSGNETALSAQSKYKDRIEVFAQCNPNYKEDLDAILGYHEKYRFKGLKPYYPSNSYDILGDKYNEWFEYGNRNRLIMLVHTGLEGIAEKVAVLSGKYPEMSFLMAHSGASYKTAKENIEVVEKRDNVYLEITYTALTNGVIEYMVDEVGAERVLFGTDMPMRDPAPQLAWICYARIPVEDKLKILSGNILRLMDRCYK